nr:MAG TPA: hypothetical protein [Caudoviricetes sp.]
MALAWCAYSLGLCFNHTPKLSALNAALFQRQIFKSITVLVSSASC